MELQDFLSHMDSGAPIEGGSEQHRFMHNAAQEAFRVTAKIITWNLRVMDVAARYGGDEFVILLPHASAELATAATSLGVHVTVETLAVDAPALGADLVVSTLPGPGANALAAHPWTAGQTVLDVVYDPWPTMLAAAARAAGATVLSGAQMLLYQAAAQVELMTGHAAPIEAMQAALRRRLDA